MDTDQAYTHMRENLEKSKDCLVGVRYIAAKFNVTEAVVRQWVRKWDRKKKRTGNDVGIPRIRPTKRCLRFHMQDVETYEKRLKEE